MKARKKFAFADGSIPEPEKESDDYEDWCANNTFVVSWIKLTIDEKLISFLSCSNNAHKLWTHIQKRFAVKNGQRVLRLKSQLANCRQKGVSIETYYGQLTKLWKSLADYQQGKTIEDIIKEREEDKLHQLFMGLDESLYGSVKSNLLSRDPLPTLDESYNVLVQDEESKLIGRMQEERSDGVCFEMQSVSKKRSRTATCGLCKNTGHLTENCFKKISYPPWWGERTRNKPPNTSHDSHVSSGKGILRLPSNNKAAKPGRVKHVFTSPHNSASGFISNVTSNSNITAADRIGITGLNDKQ